MSGVDAQRQRKKQRAGQRAAELVEDGMVVGLGSGSTALEFVRALGERVAQGLEITGIASSRTTAALARSLHIPFADLNSRVDLAVDGADVIERDTLNAIKGLGGALVREKLVALASDRFVLVADDSKLVYRLFERNGKIPVPVEILQFGWMITEHRLAKFGNPVLRSASGRPFVSDNGNYILDLFDCDAHRIEDVARQIKAISGVVEHGLFLHMSSAAIIGYDDRCEVLTV